VTHEPRSQDAGLAQRLQVGLDGGVVEVPARQVDVRVGGDQHVVDLEGQLPVRVACPPK
jgi:hypothetical protein